MTGSPISRGKNNLTQTISSLFKPFVGAGILSLPLVWSQAGIILSNSVLILLAICAAYSIFKLSECADTIMLNEARQNMERRIVKERGLVADEEFSSIGLFENNSGVGDDDLTEADWEHVLLPSFKEIGRAAYGFWGGVVVDICVLLTQIGACIAYVIFIGENMAKSTSLSSSTWVLITLLPLIALSFVRRMDIIAPTTVMGNIVYGFTILVIFYQGFSYFCCVPAQDLVLADISYFPRLFGSCAFSLEGIGVVMPVKAAMNDERQFPFAMTVAITLVTLTYFTFSSLVYITMGDVQSPVILSLPDGFLTDCVRISVSISLFFTFAVQFVPISIFCDEIIDSYMNIDIRALTQTYISYVRSRLAATHSHTHSSCKNSDLSPSIPDLDSPEESKDNDNDNDTDIEMTQLTLTPVLSHRSPSRRSPLSHHSHTNLNSTVNGRGMRDTSLHPYPNNPHDTFPLPLNHSPNSHNENYNSDNSSENSEDSEEGTTTTDDLNQVDLNEVDLRNVIPLRYTRRLTFQNISRVLVVCCICLISIGFPSFEILVALFGSLSNSALAFILPALFWVRICASHAIYGYDFFPYDRYGVPNIHPLASNSFHSGSRLNSPITRQPNSNNTVGQNQDSSTGNRDDKEGARGQRSASLSSLSVLDSLTRESEKGTQPHSQITQITVSTPITDRPSDTSLDSEIDPEMESDDLSQLYSSSHLDSDQDVDRSSPTRARRRTILSKVLLPLTIAIVGSAASIYGVYDSILNIIDFFS